MDNVSLHTHIHTHTYNIHNYVDVSDLCGLTYIVKMDLIYLTVGRYYSLTGKGWCS